MHPIIRLDCYSLLQKAEQTTSEHGFAQALTDLRSSLSLDDFAALIYKVPDRFPRLAAALPVYPSPEIQKGWTGNEDILLLQKTAMFARVARESYRDFSGSTLSGKRILDYGCGWGRLLRQMLYFSDPDQLFGVDPWEKSIAICKETRVPGTICTIDYRPKSLPDVVSAIDLAFAFSVFTHLGEENAKEILTAVRQRIAADGLFIVTVRPIEYWHHRKVVLGKEVGAEMMRLHESDQFAFIPSGASKTAGSSDYGEASCSIAKLGDIAAETGWSVVRVEWFPYDPLQVLVCLKPRA